MIKILKWGLIGLLGLIVLATTVFYGASEFVIHRKVEAPLRSIHVIADAGAVARGAKLGRVLGCDGCHGSNLQGKLFLDIPNVAKIHAPNLTRTVQTSSDAELEQAIRSGVRPDGSALWVMPSAPFSSLTDQDTADIIAWLRSHPPAGSDHPRIAFGPLGRLGVLTGQFEPAPVAVAKARASPALDAGPAFRRGRYIAVTVCSECHGSNLGGADVAAPAPDLLMAASYDLPMFTRLMRTGVAMDGKTRGLMSEVSRDGFSAFTDQDIADLHGYLTARAERMP